MSKIKNQAKSLILAQDERWRRVLPMQVERRDFSKVFGRKKNLLSSERVSNA